MPATVQFASPAMQVRSMKHRDEMLTVMCSLPKTVWCFGSKSIKYREVERGRDVWKRDHPRRRKMWQLHLTQSTYRPKWSIDTHHKQLEGSCCSGYHHRGRVTHRSGTIRRCEHKCLHADRSTQICERIRGQLSRHRGSNDSS